jgi:hypothetical protein
MLTIFAEAHRNPENRDEWFPVLRINGVARVGHATFTYAHEASTYAASEILAILDAIESDLADQWTTNE